MKSLVDNPFKLDKLSAFLEEDLGPKFDRVIYKSHNLLMGIINDEETNDN